MGRQMEHKLKEVTNKMCIKTAINARLKNNKKINSAINGIKNYLLDSSNFR